MKNKTLKFMCKILCLVLVASFVLEAPLMALETIPVSVGGQQFQVSPGQWVSVRQGTQIVHYNVRYVNGRPVALEMSQYVKLIFGDASTAAATAGTVGSSGSSNSGSASSGSSGSSSGSSVSNSGSSSTGGSALSTSGGDQAANNIRKLPQRDPVTGRFVKSDGSTSTTTNTNTSVSNTTSNSTTNTTTNNTTTNNTTTNNTTANTTTSGNSGSIVADNGGAAVTGDSNVQTSASTKRAWDPAAHPRDPETGRFIKRESSTTGSAQSGQQSSSDPVLPSDSDGIGLPGGDADGAGIPSGDADGAGLPSGDATGQNGQTGQAGQAGDGTQAGQVGDSAQSGQVGQAGDGTQAGQATDGKPSFKDKISGKFRSGYETGKTMTNQGFQNVKDSLKSGFSAKNLLVTAGITVGVDLATQIMRGEKPSAKKALKTVCSAEFAGGVVGSVTGAAAGSFFVPFLSAVPVVGGFLGALAPTFGSIVGGSVGSYLAGDLKNGRFSLKQAFKQIDWVGVAGQTVGSTVGAMLGSAIFPPFGTIIGGMVGGYVGNWAAHKIAGIFGKDKNANSTVAMPTGGNPLGGDTSVDGSVTIGETSGTTSGSVADNSDVLTIPGENTTGSIGTYESEVQLAYARYQELYNLYCELTKQGRQDDAKKIIVEMNAAKAQFDTLKAKGSK